LLIALLVIRLEGML